MLARVELLDVVVGLVLLVGLVGVVVPVLPGTVLLLGGVLAWAVLTGGATAYVVLAVVAAVLAAGQVVKYAVPGRRLQASGVPTSTLWWGAGVGVVGFFVVPVVGLLLGFVVGVYAAEHRRVGAAAARPSTVAALRAVGLSILVELTAGVLAVLVWAVGVATT